MEVADSQIEKKSGWIDRLVLVRDKIINSITNVNPDLILNDAAIAWDRNESLTIASELKLYIDTVKLSGISSDGTSIDYSALRNSEIYSMYRSECSPKLKTINLSLLRSDEETKTFWINVYNALVVDAVIEYGVERSVTEGWMGVLSFFRQAAYNVGGYNFSLEDIEHGVLRGNKGHPIIPGN